MVTLSDPSLPAHVRENSAHLEEFKTRVPIAQLPANFRDVITITRRPGLRYLWIDAICIIHNSTQD